MTPDEMRLRTKEFALAVLVFCRSLPRDDMTRTMSKQLVRCATSVGANYRAACLAKSPADMASKLKTVEEESDECCYWLELLEESGTASSDAIIPLAQEAREIFRITVASVKTIRATQRQKPESTD